MPLQRKRGFKDERREKTRKHRVRSDVHPKIEGVPEDAQVDVRVQEAEEETDEEQGDGVGKSRAPHAAARHRPEHQREEEEIERLVPQVLVMRPQSRSLADRGANIVGAVHGIDDDGLRGSRYRHGVR